MGRPLPGHTRKSILLGGLAALGIALVGIAVGTGEPARAADPARPFRAYAVAVSRDEPLRAPTATATRTPVPGATPTATPPPSTPPPGAPGEINIAPQLDTAHAVSKLVTYAEGGTLTTTGADGSKYTLTLPPHSILVDVQVTMTPLIGAGGLPASGGLKAGVQLEPDGLHLGVPATLDIVPANPVSRQQEISFAYGGNGRQAYAHGLDVGIPGTRFTLLHFSGWAIAGGDDSQRRAFFQSKVDSVVAQLSQLFAEAYAAERAREREAQSAENEAILRGHNTGVEPVPDTAERGRNVETESAEFVEAMEAAILLAYTTVVKPAMDNAESLADSGEIDSVMPGIHAYLAWERQLERLGYEGLVDERAALLAQHFRILDKVIKNAHKRCVEEHDLGMVYMLLALARESELMRGNDGGGLQLAVKCATFKLNFETTVILRQKPEFDLWAIQARAFGVPLRLFSTGEEFPVAQPLDIASWDGQAPPNCTYSSSVQPSSPFQVTGAMLVQKWLPNGKMEIQDVVMSIDPGGVSGSFTYHCSPSPDMTFPVDDNLLRSTFTVFHVAEGGPLGITMSGWEMLYGSNYAQKSYSVETTTTQERTVLTLKHTPE